MSLLGSVCILLLTAVCVCPLPDEVTLEPARNQELGLQGHTPNNGWPWRKKSATLVPAFTKTTPASTTHPTTHPTNHTTLHPTNHTTPHPANHTTHHPTNHTTPHPANHTTHHPTNHTTPHTTHHTTPHPANHTTPHPTNHTTPHPTNHTTPHPTHHTTGHLTTPHHTTVAPTTAPLEGNYQVRNGTDICLWLQAGLQIRVAYTPDDAKAKRWRAFSIQPNQTSASGNCSSNSVALNLAFHQGFLLFTFHKNTTRNTFYLGGAQAKLSLHFPGTKEHIFTVRNESLREFEAGLGRSYHCENRSLALGPDFHLDAVQERVQAFTLKGGKFGEADECLNQHSPLVPIIIGVLLLVLIIIILIAYLLGRHRSRGGYQTI
uniref:Uncharacterized protein n=1 Tax=Pelusios castaneus TaxID=367368 RepID=A0A8C8RIJ2_9SAUR